LFRAKRLEFQQRKVKKYGETAAIINILDLLAAKFVYFVSLRSDWQFQSTTQLEDEVKDCIALHCTHAFFCIQCTAYKASFRVAAVQANLKVEKITG
jgi:hypothetical protein